MLDRKKEMEAYIDNFKDMPDRLLKYNEILLEGEDASPNCYQDTMSYRRLAVEITTQCNLACQWCPRLDPKFESTLNKDLDFKLYEKFVENTLGKFRMVHLAGLGEPSMYPKLIEAIKLSKLISDNIKITSNGTLLNHEKIDQYVTAGLTHIELSIDSFNKETLQKYRGADLDYLYEIVLYISNETPLHLQINSVVSSENYKELGGMVKLFKAVKNIDIWHTIPLFETKDMHSTGNKKLETAEYQKLLLDTEEEIKKANLNWKLFPTAHGVQLDPVIEMKRKRNICFSCFEDPSINVDGRFTFCTRQGYSAVADISEGFEKSWNQPALIKFRKNMLKGIYPAYCGKLCFLKDKSAANEKRISESVVQEI